MDADDCYYDVELDITPVYRLPVLTAEDQIRRDQRQILIDEEALEITELTRGRLREARKLNEEETH